MIRTLLILVTAVGCIGHLTYKSCPVVHPMLDYDVNKAAGRWYEIKRYRNILEVSEKCSLNNSTFSGDSVMYTLTSIHSVSGAPIEWGATALQIENDTFTSTAVQFLKYAQPFQFTMTVLDTDYDNYQVLTGCRVIHGRKCEVYIWIESRNRTLDEEFMKQAYQVILYNGLPTTPLVYVDQENCPTP